MPTAEPRHVGRPDQQRIAARPQPASSREYKVDPGREGDDNRVRQDCLGCFEIVADLPDVRGDLRRINPHRLDLFGAPADGGESSPVGRPDFKSGWGREPVLGGFDSHSLPPSS